MLNGDEQSVVTGLDEVHIEGDEPATEDDNDLAYKGITLLLTNKWDESKELFGKYKSHSVLMHYGESFVNYVQGTVHSMLIIFCN